jgi:hypothetical protein
VARYVTIITIASTAATTYISMVLPLLALYSLIAGWFLRLWRLYGSQFAACLLKAQSGDSEVNCLWHDGNELQVFVIDKTESQSILNKKKGGHCNAMADYAAPLRGF